MISRRRATALLGASLLALGAGACATALSPELIQQVEQSQQSAVIMSYREFSGWQQAAATIVNVQTRQTYRFEFHTGTNVVNMRPSNLQIVPPGRYRLVDGYLYTPDASARLPLIAFWFDDFDVAAGEVLNIGTLTLEAINMASLANARGLDALFRFGNPNDVTTYVAYGADYSEDADVSELLAQWYPTFAERMVKRPLRVVLNREQFETVLVEAYTPDANGIVPDTAVARERVQARLAELLQQAKDS
jgi:hypothetical protein